MRFEVQGGAGDSRSESLAFDFHFRNDCVNSLPIRGPMGWGILRIAIDSVESNDRSYY